MNATSATTPGRLLRLTASPARTRMFSGRTASTARLPGATASPVAHGQLRRADAQCDVISVHRLHDGGEAVDPAEEACDVKIGGPGIDLSRRGFLDDDAFAHHGDPVGHAQGLGLVMGDEQRGDANALLQPPQLRAHRLAKAGVEIGERLVEQQKLRPRHQGTGQRDALLLSARQLGAAPSTEVVELNGVERLLGATSHLLRLTRCATP